MTETIQPDLLVSREGSTVTAVMNRPKALNALSIEMLRLFTNGLKEWAADGDVKVIIFKGAGDRAFCAGGDVKSAYHKGLECKNGQADFIEVVRFFGEEYNLNKMLFHYEKPILALMNGITMGGGYGIGGPCKFRVASEKTLFAMPEVGIGFFPDVGCMHYLSKCPGEIGAYLTLTGSTIGAADTVFSGLATHYVPEEKHEEMLRAYADNPAQQTLDSFHEKPQEAGEVEQNVGTLNDCFTKGSVEDVLERLKTNGGAWALQQAEIIEGRSPTSLAVSLEHYRRSQNMDFDTIIERDFALSQHFLKDHDYYEGVRAQLIDKDRNPKWQPATLDDLKGQNIADFFAPADYSLQDFAA